MEYKSYRNLWRGIRIFTDIFVFFISFFVVYFIRDYFGAKDLLENIQHVSFYFWQLPFLLFLLILIFKAYGLYDEIFYTQKLREIYFIFRSILWWILFLVLYFYIFQISFSRILFFAWIPVLFIFLVYIRLFIKNLQAKFVSKYRIVTKIGIIGSKEKIDEFLKILENYPYLGLKVIFIYIYEQKEIEHTHTEETEKIVFKINKTNIDEVIIVDDYLTYDSILNLIYKASNKRLVFRISTDIFKLATRKFEMSSLGEIPVLDLHRENPSFFYKVSKRILDIVLSIFFLVVFSLPILIIILIIKKTSKGPVFIVQERVGYKGKKFFMYKFRTMYENTSLYEKSPTDKEDKRITSFGRILRKTSMDEIPQFLNVLKGEMSIVGPRPEMPFIVDQYKPWQMKRLSAKPGITGLWQILGRKDIVLSEHLEYDFYYINNQSILYDFLILIKTIPVVFLGKGAY